MPVPVAEDVAPVRKHIHLVDDMFAAGGEDRGSEMGGGGIAEVGEDEADSGGGDAGEVEGVGGRGEESEAFGGMIS